MHPRRTRFGPASIACALAAGMLAAVLSGCAAAPVPVPTKTADAAAPIFATDEEALAAAEKAYAAYQEISNEIARDGWENIERIEPLVSKEVFASATTAAADYVAQRWAGEGGMAFDSIKLQKYEEVADFASVNVYLCMDASDARLVNETGHDVTPARRVDRTPLEVRFVSASAGSPQLLIESSAVWSGDNFC